MQTVVGCYDKGLTTVIYLPPCKCTTFKMTLAEVLFGLAMENGIWLLDLWVWHDTWDCIRPTSLVKNSVIWQLPYKNLNEMSLRKDLILQYSHISPWDFLTGVGKYLQCKQKLKCILLCCILIAVWYFCHLFLTLNQCWST